MTHQMSRKKTVPEMMTYNDTSWSGYGDTGWYLVVLGQYKLILLGI